MKNRYVGDINDYRKYGLLRLLSKAGEIKIAVCWMLTPNDGRPGGGFLKYLEQPEKFRHFDPELYDQLYYIVMRQKTRNIAVVEIAGILPSARFLPDIITDNVSRRISYFARFKNMTNGCDLVFFDPDNGIEVKSRPYGRKGSSKYVYWRELISTYSAGHSILIYQHFPRMKRDRFIQMVVGELFVKTGAQELFSYRTPHVLFLLVPQKHHSDIFRDISLNVSNIWGNQIQALAHKMI